MLKKIWNADLMLLHYDVNRFDHRSWKHYMAPKSNNE